MRLMPIRAVRALLMVAALLCARAALAGAPAPAQMRLPPWVQPLSYEVQLTIRPEQEVFQGRVLIDVDLPQARDFLWIHARDLKLRRVQATVGGKTIRASVAPGNAEVKGLRFAARLPAGRARLEFDYSGQLDAIGTRGLFRQQDAGQWYAFSQFEPVSARSAFPCFDEPQWKTPWKLTLTVRAQHVAVSNMPVARETALSGGMKRVEFEPTPPLPSYLVALGVGPFEVVDGGVAGRQRVPLRYIVPKGRSAEAAYAVEVTPRLLELLEEYFDRPYPYAKLDSMALPATSGFGAMENVGLITYRSALMLSPPGVKDVRFEQRYAGVAAHEIAHQWFGNLVTMNWWNDVWLNESFATWMARKTVASFNPAWAQETWRLGERKGAMKVDRLLSTRQVRQPVDKQDDVYNAFDSITYSKGGAVLTMFESWLGEERFRAGVRRYIDRHAHGNASAEDFFAALAASDPALAQAFAGFVEQPGVPQVSHGLECSAGKATLTLAQQRFTSPAASSDARRQSWRIPVCVRYEGPRGPASLCHLLDTPSARIELPDADHCPAWVAPNPDGIGYYLSTLSAPLMTALARAPMQGTQSAALLSDLDLLARTGALDYDLLLAFSAVQAEGPPEAALAALEAIHGMPGALVESQDKARLAAWVLKHWGPRARALGWLARDNDSDVTQRLRRALLPLVTEIGADAGLLDAARTHVSAWLQGEQALGAMRQSLLGSVAFHADAALLDALTRKLRLSRDSAERDDIYRALGRVADPSLRQKAFSLVLDPSLDARESINILWSAAGQGDGAVSVLDFARGHYDGLLARLPKDYGARLPEWGQLLCDAHQRGQFDAWFGRRAGQYPGGARNFAQALETIDICLASRQNQREALARFLRGSS
jgi:alanyl aminopeptidase